MKPLLVLLIVISSLQACTAQTKPKETPAADTIKRVVYTEAEWKKILTPEQFYVLRQKGTDRPFAGKYYLHKEKGVYQCAGCHTDLFTSDMKFDSDCGWPSFDKEIAGGKIKKVTDTSHGMVRTEIVCTKCGAHLGHLFNDGPTLTGMRYCVNSTSIDFKKE
ncbi:MAG: peptide-methionine (R)-S-oxide reductase MsrB [Cytophagales bacterium]|nr:peptide-methionine (R)-S-oxide reductase MsrB [Cytophagales bacterium]